MKRQNARAKVRAAKLQRRVAAKAARKRFSCAASPVSINLDICSRCGKALNLPHLATVITTDSIAVCLDCFEANKFHAAGVFGEDYGYTRPWQTDDRRWFADYPGRWFRIRFAMVGEDIEAIRRHRSFHAVAQASPVAQAVLSSEHSEPLREAALRMAAERLPVPAPGEGQAMAMLVIRMGPTCRIREPIRMAPRACSPVVLDSIAQEIERFVPAPTLEESEEAWRSSLAQAAWLAVIQARQVAIPESPFDRGEP